MQNDCGFDKYCVKNYQEAMEYEWWMSGGEEGGGV